MRELRFVYEAIRKGLKNQVHDMAAAIAYYTFFSIFPLLLGVIAAVGYFFESDEAQARLYVVVANALPGSADLVSTILEPVVEARGALGALGAVGLLWSASSSFGAITRAVNRAIGAERRQSFFLAKVRYLLMTVAVSVLIVLSVVVTASLGILSNVDLSLLERVGLEPGLLGRLAASLTGLISAFLVFALIYRETPYVETRWRQVLPGAILAAFVFELGKHGFLFYLSRVANFEAVYGSLSSIIVLLLWLYFSALVLVFGAEYNIVRWRAYANEPYDASTDALSREPGDAG